MTSARMPPPKMRLANLEIAFCRDGREFIRLIKKRRRLDNVVAPKLSALLQERQDLDDQISGLIAEIMTTSAGFRDFAYDLYRWRRAVK